MPTIRRCCILGCTSNSKDNIDLQFFQFPKRDSMLYQLWAEACHVSMRRILPLKKPIVCSLHFQRNVIGGRRLIQSAVPTLRLSASNELIKQEEACMMVEMERARKSSFIEACVYEWLLRMNAANELRGAINFVVIRHQAEIAKQLLNAEDFIADTKWMHRFRETHLIDFSRKVRESGYEPYGHSLKMEDIIRDLEHMFPATQSTQGYANIPTDFCGYQAETSGNNSYYHDQDADDDLQFDGDDSRSQSFLQDESLNVLDFGTIDITDEQPAKRIKIESCRSTSYDGDDGKTFPTNKAVEKLAKKKSFTQVSSYAEALEHLRPLEDFVLEKENYRAIGLISQLELLFKKHMAAKAAASH